MRALLVSIAILAAIVMPLVVWSQPLAEVAGARPFALMGLVAALFGLAAWSDWRLRLSGVHGRGPEHRPGNP